MQAIRREVLQIPTPPCSQAAALMIVDGMSIIVEGHSAFLADEGDYVVGVRLEKGLLMLLNGYEQVKAIAEGRPTPIPMTNLNEY